MEHAPRALQAKAPTKRSKKQRLQMTYSGFDDQEIPVATEEAERDKFETEVLKATIAGLIEDRFD